MPSKPAITSISHLLLRRILPSPPIIITMETASQQQQYQFLTYSQSLMTSTPHPLSRPSLHWNYTQRTLATPTVSLLTVVMSVCHHLQRTVMYQHWLTFSVVRRLISDENEPIFCH